MEGEELEQKVSAFILGLLLLLARGCRLAGREYVQQQQKQYQQQEQYQQQQEQYWQQQYWQQQEQQETSDLDAP